MVDGVPISRGIPSAAPRRIGVALDPPQPLKDAGSNLACRQYQRAKAKRPAKGRSFILRRLTVPNPGSQAASPDLRRRRQATIPLKAIRKPGIPAPTIGPGTAAGSIVKLSDASVTSRSAKKIFRGEFELPVLKLTVLICPAA